MGRLSYLRRFTLIARVYGMSLWRGIGLNVSRIGNLSAQISKLPDLIATIFKAEAFQVAHVGCTPPAVLAELKRQNKKEHSISRLAHASA